MSELNTVIQGLSKLRPMERRRFIKSAKCVCEYCNEEKNLTLFADKPGDIKTFLSKCRKCRKKLREQEIIKMVFDVMKSENFK